MIKCDRSGRAGFLLPALLAARGKWLVLCLFLSSYD